jgi:hypothetical protein
VLTCIHRANGYPLSAVVALKGEGENSVRIDFQLQLGFWCDVQAEVQAELEKVTPGEMMRLRHTFNLSPTQVKHPPEPLAP